jgi:sugar phosphate isomerase/epimerase
MWRIIGTVVGGFILAGGLQAAEPGRPATRPAANPFYVFDFCVQDEKHPTPESQAAMLEELGVDGISYGGIEGIPERLAALDRHGLKLFTVYTPIHLDGNKPAYDPRLSEAIKLLAGHGTMLWIYILSERHRPSSVEGDPAAVEIIRDLADKAAAARLKIALYPHVNHWLERIEDAVRLAKKVDRPNVGVTFNLCHWLRVDPPETLNARLELARPYLLQVSINGADADGKDWDTLIQPLDRGSFDIGGLLKILRRQDYRGPIGLQCYGVKGDKYENLKRSMQAWRKLKMDARQSATGSGR